MKEKKSSTGAYNHERAMVEDRNLYPLCDPGVQEGIEAVWELATPKHSIGGPYSMEKLVRDHVDEPLAVWLSKYGVVKYQFSKQLARDESNASVFFDQLHAKIEVKFGEERATLFTDLAPTCSSLIDFSFFCRNHCGDNEQVVEVRSLRAAGKPSEVHIEAKRAKKPRRRPSKMPVGTDFTGDVRSCAVCSGLNEQAVELLRIRREWANTKSIVKEEAKALLQNPQTRIVTPGFSSQFCARHSPAESPSQYKVAARRRVLYGSTRRFLISARQAAKLIPSPIDVIRTAAFLVADKCPDQVLISEIPGIVSKWYSEWDGLGTSQECFAKHMEKIVVAFEASDHPLAAFVTTLARGSGRELLASALEHGVTTPEIESLIADGFIDDPFVTALRNGGTILSPRCVAFQAPD